MNRAPWVIVAGGANRLGGTDKANSALVEYLAEMGHPVHLVTHNAGPELHRLRNVSIETIPVPAKSWFLGEKLLAHRGQQRAAQTVQQDPRARVVVNGGNCFWPDINWVHRVHHAWAPKQLQAPPLHRMKHLLAQRSARKRELKAVGSAQLVVANSELTRRQLIEYLHINPELVQTVYLGNEIAGIPKSVQRPLAKSWLGIPAGKTVIAFVGALGFDHNKGMDTLLSAWQRLQAKPTWNAQLVVAGDGRTLPYWKKQAAQNGLADSITFLGFTDRVDDLLAGADLLVSPVRYESFGLNVQEALCQGVPAIVSANAGVAERYTPEMRELLLPNAEDAEDLAERIYRWSQNREHWRAMTDDCAKGLRAYTWHDMAEQIYQLANGVPAKTNLPSRVMARGQAR